MPRCRINLQAAHYVLRAKRDIQDITQLDESCEFIWESHPSLNNPKNSKDIRNSWRNCFMFKQEDTERQIGGLRLPQLGAIHAIASHWTANSEPATIVMRQVQEKPKQ